MKAVEFQSQLTPERTLLVPNAIAETIPLNQPLRVLVLIGESQTDREWEELAARDFAQGYAESDAIYDHA